MSALRTFGEACREPPISMIVTVRNGSQDEMRAKRGKLYCEKVMIVGVDQVTPMHFHGNKVEDIINRGGGELVIQLSLVTRHFS